MRTSKWVVALYSLVVLIGIIIALPNFFTQKQLDALPSWLPKRQVTLGLDLRGGSYLVLEVDAAALKRIACAPCSTMPAASFAPTASSRSRSASLATRLSQPSPTPTSAPRPKQPCAPSSRR